jgi:7-keto-8-aminopelargonate synthetase-like enzyme
LLFQAAAIRTLKKYGVGSCGPRGFYGTMGTFIYQNIETEAQTHIIDVRLVVRNEHI